MTYDETYQMGCSACGCRRYYVYYSEDRIGFAVVCIECGTMEVHEIVRDILLPEE